MKFVNSNAVSLYEIFLRDYKECIVILDRFHTVLCNLPDLTRLTASVIISSLSKINTVTVTVTEGLSYLSFLPSL